MNTKRNTNANTEHSRNLRGKTANAHNSRMLKEGLKKHLRYQGSAEEVDTTRERMNRFREEKNMTGIEAINCLLDFYYEQNKI